MMTVDIEYIEKGALEFAKIIYGKALADIMYLGTYNSICYFGPIFYEMDTDRKSCLITCYKDKYNLLPSEKLLLDSEEDQKEFQRKQLIWWDYIGVIQCAFRRGKRKAIASPFPPPLRNPNRSPHGESR